MCCRNQTLLCFMVFPQLRLTLCWPYRWFSKGFSSFDEFIQVRRFLLKFPQNSLKQDVIVWLTSWETTRLRPGKLECRVKIRISPYIVNKAKTEISSQGQSRWQSFFLSQNCSKCTVCRSIALMRQVPLKLEINRKWPYLGGGCETRTSINGNVDITL